jgi:hypothetical protein
MNLEETGLFRALDDKCATAKPLPFKGNELLALVTKAAREMANVLNRACVQFEDYTLHDEQHAIRVVHWMHRLLPPGTIATMSVVDLALLILSAYGHDTGMSVGRERRDQIVMGTEYKDFLLFNEGAWIEAEQARESNDLVRYEYLSARLFQEYLRGKHHLLSADLVMRLFTPVLELDGKSLADPLSILCRSHGQSVAEVANLEPEPFAGDFLVDMTFLACVLRLADYIDLDAARAPRSLMEWLRPGNVVSYREWRKHQMSRFFVTSKEIRFSARFEDFFEEKVLRDTLDGLEQERRDCMELLARRDSVEALRLDLHAPVSKKFHSVGYLYEEFRFQLEYRQIVSLLMGTRLYRDERVFVRELFQNALDACRYAESAAVFSGRHGYHGKISFRRYIDPSGRQVIEVSDNGSGMTRPIIREYFMRVGRSFYQSFAFRRRGLDFEAVSQFGIGILSCFMKADYLEVETRSDSLVHGEEGQTDKRGLKLEIRGPHQFFVVRELSRSTPGTTVRVFLKSPLAESLSGLVERFVGRTPYTVEIQDSDAPAVTLGGLPFDFKDERFNFAYMPMRASFSYAVRDLEFTGKFGFGLRGILRFFLFEADGQRHLHLRNVGKYSSVSFGPHGESLLKVKQLSQDDRRKLLRLLDNVRGFQDSFSVEVRSDIDSILKLFDRVCDHLSGPSDNDEVSAMWESLQAQVEALVRARGFKSKPNAFGVRKQLKQALEDVKSFISGELRFPPPAGILTQDGINLGNIIDLRPRLKFGVGYLYNLDLCGKHRLSLTAARDAVIIDDRSEALFGHLSSVAGRFLGEWFRDEALHRDEVSEYLRSVPRPLAETVEQAYAGRLK